MEVFHLRIHNCDSSPCPSDLHEPCIHAGISDFSANSSKISNSLTAAHFSLQQCFYSIGMKSRHWCFSFQLLLLPGTLQLAIDELKLGNVCPNFYSLRPQFKKGNAEDFQG